MNFNSDDMKSEVVVCKRCLMDTTASNISFDKQGICCFCTRFLNQPKQVFHFGVEEKAAKRSELIEKIKRDGKGKSYDCIIGVSGGVDSSYVLVKAIEMGLRPLAVHMDNGWNSELAQNNIANLINKLGIDLYTHVIEWSEYKNLMQAFFDANVLDIELLYDNAMMAVNFQQAANFGVKYILSGVNTSTEGMEMPEGWNWFKYDKRNIKAIGKKFGDIKIDSFPSIGTIDFIKFKFVNKIEWLSFLDYFDYEKKSALDLLETHFAYKPYPYKHYESIFTRFYQGYILPNKFNVDKRKLHYSTLILTNQISREEALKVLDHPPYPSAQDLQEDIVYFLKKMNWSRNDLDRYISAPEVQHDVYPSEKNLWDKLVLGNNNSVVYKLLKSFIMRLTGRK